MLRTLSGDVARLGSPETEEGLNSHFPFFWANAVTLVVGFPCVHGGMGADDVGAKEALKWGKVLQDGLESRWTSLLHIFSWLTGVGGSHFRDAFRCTQPGKTEGPVGLGAPTPTQHLCVGISITVSTWLS